MKLKQMPVPSKCDPSAGSAKTVHLAQKQLFVWGNNIVKSPIIVWPLTILVLCLTIWRPLLPHGYSYTASCARPGWAVICNFWHPGTLTLRAERQSARMSKITNDGLTRSGTGCFIAVSIWQQWAPKGQGSPKNSPWVCTRRCTLILRCRSLPAFLYGRIRISYRSRIVLLLATDLLMSRVRSHWSSLH